MTSQQIIFIVCLRVCVWDLIYVIKCLLHVGISLEFTTHTKPFISVDLEKNICCRLWLFSTHNFIICLCFSEACKKNGGSTCIMDTPSALISSFFIQCTYFINLGFILLRFYYCDELCNFSIKVSYAEYKSNFKRNTRFEKGFLGER